MDKNWFSMQMPDDGIKRDPGPVLNGIETVLVDDDFEEVRSFLSVALAMFGYSVICAGDGVDGLKKYMENKDRINVMLLDIVMPKLNGIELCNIINELGPDCKVLFMSGYNETLSGNNLQNRIKCVSKPFKIETLLKEMRGGSR